MPGSPAAELRRALLRLVVLVALVDAGFAALYLATGLGAGPAALKLGYAVLWTGVTLLVVLRSLTRIRTIRGRR